MTLNVISALISDGHDAQPSGVNSSDESIHVFQLPANSSISNRFNYPVKGWKIVSKYCP